MPCVVVYTKQTIVFLLLVFQMKKCIEIVLGAITTDVSKIHNSTFQHNRYEKRDI